MIFETNQAQKALKHQDYEIQRANGKTFGKIKAVFELTESGFMTLHADNRPDGDQTRVGTLQNK